MTAFNPETDCLLLIDGAHGVHIPALFCGHWEAELEAQGLGAEASIIADENADPQDQDMCWDEILDSAILEISGAHWTLYQDQDLWAVREGVELPDEWE